MQHQIYAERDTTLYEKHDDRNTGIDQILELVKTTSGSRLDDLFQVNTYNTRILIDFKGTQFTALSQSIHNGEMGIIQTRKFYLNLKHIYATDMPISYSLHAYPVSESWTNGNGNYADVPETTNGASWLYRDGTDNGTKWDTGSAHSAGQLGMTEPRGGGTWITGSGYEASQQFDYQSPDVRMEVTPIVIKWLSGNIPNNGFMLRQSYDAESNNGDSLNLKFFSKDTHTVYAPRLEVVWQDVQNTGTSLTETNVTASGGPILYFKNIEEKYPEGSQVQFRLGIRSKYPTRSYQTSSYYTTNEILPPNSSSYAVCDAVTGETLLDYDDTYTCISNDKQGSYFNYWMNALSPERYYKFKIRAKYNSGIIKYFDNGYYFKVVR